jgi:hypothetical protein
MKYAAEMGSSAKTYIPNFIKIGSGVQKLMGGGYTYANTQTTRRSYIFFFKMRKIGWKYMIM